MRAVSRSRICAIALAAAAALSAGSASAHGLSGGPATRLAASLAAGEHQRSVHYVSYASSSSVSVTMVGDAGRTAGIQRITYSKGGKSGHVTVIVVADTAYIRGDAFTLTSYMGLSPSAAAKSAGKWLTLTHHQAGYATVAAGVRLSSALDELKLKPPIAAVAPSRLGGVPVIGLRSTHVVSGRPVTSTVYVRRSGAPLPVEAVARRGAQRMTVTFSHWNEPLNLAAPTGGRGNVA
jgi:hypothetical protein